MLRLVCGASLRRPNNRLCSSFAGVGGCGAGGGAGGVLFAPLSTTTAGAAAAASSSSGAAENTTTTTSDVTNKSGGVFDKIACIGTGKMAQAVIEPLIRTSVQPANKIVGYDVNPSIMQDVSAKYGIGTSESLPELVEGADLVLCCVKPQNLTPDFFDELRKGIIVTTRNNDENNNDTSSILLSIVAGKTIPIFRNGGFTKIVRSMPNTPATIGQGMTVWSCTPNLTIEERKKIREVLCTCGKTMYVDDESFIDMATSISGSGPAYIFMLMESMIDAGVHMGFPRDKATTLVYHTMLGSTLYAMETGEHPAILRNSVTSPSGTTASALYELENGRFRTVIKDAMWACYRRSLEMGNHDSNVGPGRIQKQQQAPPPAAAQAPLLSSSDSVDDERLHEKNI